MKITIKADADYNLRETYDRLLDGELGELMDGSEISGPAASSGLFSGGKGRIPVITITLKSRPTDEEFADLVAQLRMMIGSKAHLHIDR